VTAERGVEQDSRVYPEIAALELDAPLAARAQEFVASLGPVPWTTFGRIPHAVAKAGQLHKIRDLVSARWLRQYRFPAESAAQPALLAGLSEVDRTRFRLLCEGEALPRGALESIAGSTAVQRAIDQRLLIARGDRLIAALLFVPFGDHFYLSDAFHVVRNRAAYPFDPSFLGEATEFELATIRRHVRERPVKRMLEMGSGIGIATLELAAEIEERVGAEINLRSLGMARANQELRGDRGARFVQSDLFSTIQGHFDLILFNPWWPSVRAMGLIRRFLIEAQEHLSAQGLIVLAVLTEGRSGRDPVLDELAGALEALGLGAEREVVYSYLRRESGVASAWALSLLSIERETGPRGIRHQPTRGLLSYVARRAAARAVTAIQGRRG
jgi:hypothetical protein